VRLLITSLLSAMLDIIVTAMARRHDCRPALEIDVHASCILLSHVLQAEFLTHLLNPGLDLLDVVDGVVSFTNDTMLRLV
jgi:hypothetical protein